MVLQFHLSGKSQPSVYFYYLLSDILTNFLQSWSRAVQGGKPCTHPSRVCLLFCYLQAVEALIPHNQKPPSGLPQLVQLCCTFGSTLMLPLLFISSSMAGEAAVQAMGYTSLFYAAWSPLFWVLGYNLLAAAAWSGDGGGVGRSRRMGE